MSEIHLSPGSKLPPQPTEQYLSYGSTAEIAPSTLYALALGASALQDPYENYNGGWMWNELLRTPPSLDGTSQEALTPEQRLTAHRMVREGYGVSASDAFAKVINSPHAGHLLKCRAQVSKAAVPLYFAMGNTMGDPGTNSYLDRWVNVMLGAAERFTKTEDKDPADIGFMHQLTTLLLLNGRSGTVIPRKQSKKRGNLPPIHASKKAEEQARDEGNQHTRAYIAAPAPTRFSQPTDPSDHSWNIALWQHLLDGQVFCMRVGVRGNGRLLGVSPAEALLQDEYPSKHGLGTLQAILDAAKHGRPQARAHIRHAEEALYDHIDREMMRHVAFEGWQANLDGWYGQIPPNANPYLFEPGLAEPLVSQKEVAFWSKELDPKGVYQLATLRAEMALGSAETANPGDIAADFDRAIDLYTDVIENRGRKYADERLMLMRHYAYIGRANARIQKAIALKEANLSEHIREYGADLCDVSERLLTTYDSLFTDLQRQTGNPTKAYEKLHALFYGLTVGIAAAADPFNRYVACIAPQRQHDAHHLTVFAQSPDETFSLPRRGYIRFASEDGQVNVQSSLANKGVLPLQPADLGHKTSEGFDGLATVMEHFRELFRPPENYVELNAQVEWDQLGFIMRKLAQAAQYIQIL